MRTHQYGLNKSSKSRKFPRDFENPIDNFIIDNGRKMFSFYKSLGFTPNTLTTFSLILGILSAYFFYKKWFILSALCYFNSYCYDVLDGNYAREYNLVSKFGDIYDHIKDIFVNILMVYVFYKYTVIDNKNLLIAILVITLILFITLNIHLGCQERYVEENELDKKSDFLNFLTLFCSKDTIRNVKILKYFGCGSYSVWVSFIILLNIKYKL